MSHERKHGIGDILVYLFFILLFLKIFGVDISWVAVISPIIFNIVLLGVLILTAYIRYKITGKL